MTGLGTCLVVVIIRNLVEIRESPALLAVAILASHARNVGTGQHAEGATAAKVFGGGGGFLFAERVERFFTKEVIAEVDEIGPCRVVGVWVLGGEKSGVADTVCDLVRIHVNDKAEFGDNFVSGVVSEISFVKLIGAIILDVLPSMYGQRSGFRDALIDEGFASRNRAADREFALGEAVGDGDGDGTGVGGVDRGGIGGGLNAVVDPDRLEPRDRVEGESSWAAGREIVQGRHYQAVPLNRGHECSFWF